MQASVRFGPVRRNPLRRSCVLRVRNAGESAFWPGPAEPSAEIARVEGEKCRRECVLARSGATLCGDRAYRGREMQVRYQKWPVCRTNVVGKRAFRSWTQKWPVCSAKVVRERASRSWTQKWPVCSANVVREGTFSSWTHTWPVCSAHEEELFGAGLRSVVSGMIGGIV